MTSTTAVDIPAGFIMPNFGPRSGATTTTTTATGEVVAGGAPAYAGPRKIAFICSKGNLDMAYPALIMGNAALSEGAEVHIFFTFWGLDILNTKLNHKLRYTMTGNTAMHMPELGKIRAGAEHHSLPQQLGGLPGMTTLATRQMKQMMEAEDIPEIPEFLDMMAAAGAHFYACKLTFDMYKMIEADLHPACEGVISASDFIVISEGAQVIFV
ncbi:Peroxiredoxin family protein [Raineyella antarctica]|uniref:Peroxiredoxin family protein n=1 Tax=Raineyella antarctica TaxID=1577474 RepID=A0A1G6GGP8_9ACTN|nr:DsrE/DsrF/DrsH-like family protein [Raineyella antarctica]SDB80356.1 Peroxiredoxin family protein [Raineyella antarctica]